MIYGNAYLTDKLKECISPFEPDMVNPASYNVRLGNTFLIPRKSYKLKLGNTVKYAKYELEKGRTIMIAPGGFMLATTMEYIKVPVDCACFVQGRSSIGRMGLSVQNAGFVDPGFDGAITLELKNETKSPIELIPGYPVAQLVFMQARDVTEPYQGKYNGQIEATGSRIQQDKAKYRTLFKKTETAITRI